MRAPVPDAGRKLLLDGLIACLPKERYWEQAEREHWFRLLHFLLDWLLEVVEEEKH